MVLGLMLGLVLVFALGLVLVLALVRGSSHLGPVRPEPRRIGDATKQLVPATAREPGGCHPGR